MEESIESMMDEIRGRLELLKSNLPKHVDGCVQEYHAIVDALGTATGDAFLLLQHR